MTIETCFIVPLFLVLGVMLCRMSANMACGLSLLPMVLSTSGAQKVLPIRRGAGAIDMLFSFGIEHLFFLTIPDRHP